MTEQHPQPDREITRGACATPRCCRRFLPGQESRRAVASQTPGHASASLPLRHKGSNTSRRVARLRHNDRTKRPGRNPVVQLRHKHQDTPARRYHCDTTRQTRLGVSRDCVTNTGPSARAGIPSCRCVTNTRTRQRVATTATQRVKHVTACRAITSQTPGQAPGQESRRADYVTNTRTRQRVATTATQRVKHVTACRGNLDRLVCPPIPSPQVATRRVLADFAKTPTLERWQP